MRDNPKIVLAHNERVAKETLARDLTQKGYRVRATESFDTLWRWIRAGEGDLVLIDVDISDPARNGFELLKQIREAYPALPVMVLSAENTVLTSLLAARFGAFDYFPKPFSFEQLTASIVRALQAPLGKQKGAPARSDLPLIGSSAPMQQVYRLIGKATQSDLPVLVTGETGTGKSLVAKMLHDYGDRAKFGCSVLHFPLNEDEFDQTVAAHFKDAESGTLILDEVSTLSSGQQARLVSILAHYEGQPNAPRLVSTTRTLPSEGHKQDDLGHELLYRLNILQIVLPPLRDRQSDAVELGRAFCAEFSKGVKFLSLPAERSLVGMAWPGNVRQLRNIVQSAVLMARSDAIAPEDISQKEPGAYHQGNHELEDTISRALAISLSDFDEADYPDGLYSHTLAALERPLMERVMAMVDRNQLKAAKMLGINRNTLHKKLMRYRIRRHQD